MKKVLSVLLAAAMVMGMSVSAFAANFSVPGSVDTKEQNVKDMTWEWAAHVEDKTVTGFHAVDTKGTEEYNFDLEEGDRLLFGFTVNDQYLTQGAPSNWILKAEANEYVEDVYFANLSELKLSNPEKISGGDLLVVVVELASDFDAKAEEEAGELVELYMYIWDTINGKSEPAFIHYEFDEYDVKTVGYKSKGADYDITEVIPASSKVYYKLHADSKLNSAMVVFGLNGDTYVTAKMWAEESYMITSKVNAKWSKELSKQYDTDIELLTIESDLDVREVMFEAKKDNKQVVEVVDGELVAVEAEFVTKYEVIDGVVLAKGYIAETEEGSYALISADIELIEVEEEATKEENKENPSTGANDFVGAAVALAVVSVAAAGALALKK